MHSWNTTGYIFVYTKKKKKHNCNGKTLFMDLVLECFGIRMFPNTILHPESYQSSDYLNPEGQDTLGHEFPEISILCLWARSP